MYFSEYNVTLQGGSRYRMQHSPNWFGGEHFYFHRAWYKSVQLNMLLEVLTVLAIYCCVTNYHKFSFKQHTFIISQFLWFRSLGTLCFVFWEAAFEVSEDGSHLTVWLGNSSFQSGYWQNSLPCSCRIGDPIFSLAVLCHLGLLPSKPTSEQRVFPRCMLPFYVTELYKCRHVLSIILIEISWSEASHRSHLHS